MKIPDDVHNEDLWSSEVEVSVMKVGHVNWTSDEASDSSPHTFGQRVN